MLTSTVRRIRKLLFLKPLALGFGFPISLMEKYRELVHLRRVLDELHIECVLDVGANVGQFAEDLRDIGYRGRIISFEPIKGVFDALQQRLRRDDRWSGHHCALGAEHERRMINVSEDTAMSSMLEPGAHVVNTRQEEIEIHRLDDLLDQIGLDPARANTLLKIDTQGFDLEVLRGAERHLPSIRALMSEVSVIPFYREMVDYKEALGVYEAAGFSLVNLSVVNRNHHGQIVEFNCLMKRLGGDTRAKA